VKCIKNTCGQPTETVNGSDADKLGLCFGIVNALAAYQAIRGSAELLTPSIVFDDVEPDLDYQQEIQIQVTSCGEITFQVETDGHNFGIIPGTYSHDPCSENPFTLVATYSATDGDTETGTITVTWDQRPDNRWEIGITAQRAVRRTSLYLVLDKSGSMASNSGIGSYTRLEVLKYSAGILVDQFPPGNGIGAVSFNSAATAQADYTVMDPGDLPGSRTTVKTAINDMASGGQTSIAAGILAARDHLDALPADDAKAIIVLTDGRQTHEPWLNDLLAEEIGCPIYAIGMGNASTIQPDDLIEVTGSTDGYTVLTGNLDIVTENLVAEFLSQILSDILDGGVPTDPTQHILPGVVHRFPILLSEADKNVEVILLRPPGAPLVHKVIDPDGNPLDPDRISESGSDRLVRFTFEGPHAHGRPGFPVNGMWHVEVSVPPDDFSAWIKNMDNRGVDTRRLRLHGPAYTFRVHARTNLKMKCRVSQSGYSPGSTLSAHVKLTDRGRRLNTQPTVTALLTDPWGDNRTLSLRRGQSGLWEASVKAPLPGIYTWEITAEGRTLAGHAFRRQCKLTGAVWTSVTPGPPGPPGPPTATPSGGPPIGAGPA
jgi:hypothetical protein